MVYPASATEQSLFIAFPRNNYETTSQRVFFLGTAPPAGEVLVNGKPIQRSSAGHFAPSLPLQMGENVFNFRYQNQEIQIKVMRNSSEPQIPEGVAFAKDSLTPSVDIAKLPGELICFGAIAPPNANVSVKLGNQTIPLLPQTKQVKLPSNLAILTGNNQPKSQSSPGKYEGCGTVSTAGELGKPQFQLTLSGQTITQSGTGNISILSPVKFQVAEVTADSGVARTGPSTDYSRLTPLPRGTRASITGREGEWLRLDYGGWINSKETQILPGATPPRAIIRSVAYRRLPGKTEMIFPLTVPVPVTTQQGDRSFTLILYNTTAQTDIIRLDDDPIISRLDWQQVAPGQVKYTFNLKHKQHWGYKLRYEGTNLILSVRHYPIIRGNLSIPQDKPLAGVRILLDPGHGGKESGAPGPTGYLEKDVNLTVSKLLRQELIQRGATVYMTREDDRELSLPDRVAIINRLEPAIALSIHYNSLPDYGQPEKTKGVGMFWYHPQAHGLAVFLHNYLVDKLGRPSYGVFWNNLALARPESAPSVLLELGFMSNPQEFEWIMNPQQQQQLSVALADGIVGWFKSVR
jgi:N-acetylmuramoyl-L-alanine amidase